jgi:hypothetical protein
MKTLREKYNITPEVQRKLSKYLCEKLKNIMVSLDGEDKINIKLDEFFSMKDDCSIENIDVTYNIHFNSNDLKIWINEFKDTGD